MEKRIIIGLTGTICGGKGTLATHLIDLGFNHFVLSDRIRDEIRIRGQEITRALLQDVGNELRNKFGGAVLAQRTADLMADAEGNVVIDGVRNPDEIKFLRNVLGASILGVDAPKETRCEWYLERAKSRGEDGTSIADFERDNNRDLGIGEPGTGQQVSKCLELADVVIENNGSKQDLFNECNQFLKDNYHFDIEIHRAGKEK